MPSVLTIGNFDAVHLGHAALVARARAIAAKAGAGTRVVALVFHPHPLSLIRPESAPAALSTFDQRARLLRVAGVDEAVQLHPTPDLLALSPRAFVEKLVRDHAPMAIVEGYDFRFGKDRAGDNSTLIELGRQHGFESTVIDPVEAVLTDQTIVTVSSSMVRWLLQNGRVADAARLLGRPFALEGIVVRGDQRGREIGFPTANLATPCMLPADGVYAGHAVLPDGRRRPAAIHVGTRSTFNDHTRTVEACILDWPGPVSEGAAEYSWPLTLELTHWLRDQARFDGIDALVEQIKRDVDRTRRLTSANTESKSGLQTA